MKVTIPVRIASPVVPFDKEGVLKELRKFGAHRIAFTLLDVDDIGFICAQIKELIPYFESNGLETCVWMGGSLMHFIYKDKKFVERVSVTGESVQDRICPFDKEFLEYYGELLKKILESGIKTVYFDDDFRINFWTGPVGCFCPLHRARHKELLGEDVPLEVMREHILKGAPNKYRKAWQQANAESLLGFAKHLRKVADSVDKSIRLGTCTSHAIWGTDAWVEDIIQALAGENKPFLRVWGGPYGASRVGYAIEYARFCFSVLEGKDWEIMAEGDVYPRPRYCLSASKLEGFDTAIRASIDNADMLKYGMDYFARPDYETGYADFAEHNKSLYPQIEKLFRGKEPVGYNLVVYPNKIGEYVFEKDMVDNVDCVMKMPTSHLIADNGLAGVYNKKKNIKGSILFGQNACFAEEEVLENGVVLDSTAAKILTERGIDVGLVEDKGALPKIGFMHEWYVDEDSPVWIPNWYPDWGYQHIEVSGKAHIRTKLLVDGKEYVGAYTYENAQGHKFFVLPFDAESNMDALAVFRTYARQRQLVDMYEYLTGGPLDAVCLGSPDTYMVVRKNEDSLSVGLWNFSDDRIDAPIVKLGGAYKEVTTIVGGEAKLKGKEVRLSVLYPYEFIGFEVRK